MIFPHGRIRNEKYDVIMRKGKKLAGVWLCVCGRLRQFHRDSGRTFFLHRYLSKEEKITLELALRVCVLQKILCLQKKKKKIGLVHLKNTRQ